MRSKKIAVAMSGGVDSSVCAALLLEEGFSIFGITMQIGNSGKIKAAKRVARHLGIPHHVVDFRDAFRRKVIADFCAEYKRGRTPNPCIRCNQYIKFTALFKEAGKLGADFIATGHYARIAFERRKGRYLLKKGIDARKDQSYFLYVLKQRQLAHTLMPLGELTKAEVKQIAKDKKLSVAQRPESQEICFIPDNRYGEFLKKYMPEGARPGAIVNKKGKIIGKHQGIIFYTVGQRKRMGIAWKEPLYVISIDKKNNRIVAGTRAQLYGRELLVNNLNLVCLDRIKAPLKARVSVRFLHPAAEAVLFPVGKNRIRVRFKRPQFAITPGQAAVFYQKDIVLGGGTIADFS